MYNGPIIDAHQHFWEPEVNHHPWLSKDCLIPFRYGDYSAIKCRYLPDDYLADAGEHHIVATVYIDAEWNPDDPIGETSYIHEIARQYHYPNAMVAQAWLNQPEIDSLLQMQAGWSLVRSIRHKPGGAESWQAAKYGQRSLMCDEKFRQGYALLEKYNLHFDLQTPWWYLNEACDLANDFPNTLMILNHTGLPADRSFEGLSHWHQAMSEFAKLENVVVKISGLGQKDIPWTVDNNLWIVRETIAMFGTERCMFASNFPVDSLCVRLDDLWHGFKEIVHDLPLVTQRALFFDNACRIYTIDCSDTANGFQQYL